MIFFLFRSSVAFSCVTIDEKKQIKPISVLNMATSETGNDPYKVVAAIYIGASFSGYAYSTNTSFKMDPLNIKQTRHWYSDSKLKYIRKTPTSLLLDKEKKFISFGHEAEDQHSEFMMKKKKGDYYFIRNLTLQMCQSQVGYSFIFFCLFIFSFKLNFGLCSYKNGKVNEFSISVMVISHTDSSDYYKDSKFDLSYTCRK